MNLIPYSIFIYLNYILAGLIIVLPFVNGASTTTQIFFAILGAALFFICLSSKNKKLPPTEMLSQRFVILSIFISAVILPFTHIFLGFTNNTLMLWTIYIISSLQLISLIFFKLEE